MLSPCCHGNIDVVKITLEIYRLFRNIEILNIAAKYKKARSESKNHYFIDVIGSLAQLWGTTLNHIASFIGEAAEEFQTSIGNIRGKY